VGLANTLYKLWTRIITNTLYDYAELCPLYKLWTHIITNTLYDYAELSKNTEFTK